MTRTITFAVLLTLLGIFLGQYATTTIKQQFVSQQYFSQVLPTNDAIYFSLTASQNQKPSIRKLLSQSQPPHNNNNGASTTGSSENIPQSTFLLIVIICSIAVSIAAIVCCVALIIRCIAVIQGRAHVGGKVGNASKLDYGVICPEIQDGLFYAYVGRPLQDNCVICLEQFQNTEKNVKNADFIPIEITQNKIKQQKQQKNQRNIQPKQLPEANKIQQNPQLNQYCESASQDAVLIKMTVCGHVLHSKCLTDWLQKQDNCPLCRQLFTQQKLHEWQQKLQMTILKFDCNVIPIKQQNDRSHVKIRVTQSLKHEQTLNSITKRRRYKQNQQGDDQVPNCSSMNIKPNKDKDKDELTIQQKNILKFYHKIMSYHKKQPIEMIEQRDQMIAKGNRKITNQLYFSNQQQQQREQGLDEQKIEREDYDNDNDKDVIEIPSEFDMRTIDGRTQMTKTGSRQSEMFSSLKLKYRKTMTFSSTKDTNAGPEN